MIDVSGLTEVKFESSSRGNQRKFYHNGNWIKLDSERCSQGLAEEFVSAIEGCIPAFNFVPYRSVQVVYNEDIYNACICSNMYNPDVQFVSLRSLFRHNNTPLKTFIADSDIAQNIRNVISIVHDLTGLNISGYLRDLLFLDALILNEDRHYMNLGVCSHRGRFVIAPCFDNGSSLFCVNWTYRRSKTLLENIESAKSVARPFSKFYDKQVDALLSLGATPLCISRSKLDYVLQSYSNPLYDDAKVWLIKQVLIQRLQYYLNKGVFIYVQ